MQITKHKYPTPLGDCHSDSELSDTQGDGLVICLNCFPDFVK